MSAILASREANEVALPLTTSRPSEHSKSCLLFRASFWLHPFERYRDAFGPPEKALRRLDFSAGPSDFPHKGLTFEDKLKSIYARIKLIAGFRCPRERDGAWFW